MISRNYEKRRIEILQSRCDRLRSENEALITDNESKQKVIDEFKGRLSQIETVEKELRQSIMSARETQKQYESMRESLAELRKKYNAEITKLIKGFRVKP